MPRYRISNTSRATVRLPPPVSISIPGQTNVVIDAPATDFDTADVQRLIRSGVLRFQVTTENPLVSDHIEIPVVDMLGGGSTTAVEVGPTAPSTLDGTVLWLNSLLGYRLLNYDLNRGKWLSVEEYQVTAGRNGTTAAGGFYRGADSMVFDLSTRGIPVLSGTLTSIAMSRTDTGAAVLQTAVNGSVIHEFTTSVSGASRDDSLDIDFSAGLLSFRNKAPGSNTQNVQIVATYRLRG